MNEFVAKKLGEVLAFARIGQEMVERGDKALEAAYGPEGLTTFTTALGNQRQAIEARANKVTTAKAEATTGKLRSMMELYVGDEWDNSTELLEWSGFYFGSAEVHWALVSGAAEALAQPDLLDEAQQATTLNQSMLELVKARITEVAKQKAVA